MPWRVITSSIWAGAPGARATSRHTVEQRLGRVEVALEVGERRGDQAHSGVRVVGHARQGVGRGGHIAVAEVRPGHAGQQPGDRVRRRLAQCPAVARDGGRVALLGEGVGPDLEQPEAGGLVGDVGVGGAPEDLAMELRVPGAARAAGSWYVAASARAPAASSASAIAPGSAARATWACATARQMSTRSPGDTSSASLAASAGSTNRWPCGVRSMWPAASASATARPRRAARCGGRAEVVERHDLAQHGRGAQDGEHVRGEVLGRRLRGVDHHGLEGLPGTRPGAEGHDDRDGLAARCPRRGGATGRACAGRRGGRPRPR